MNKKQVVKTEEDLLVFKNCFRRLLIAYAVNLRKPSLS